MAIILNKTGRPLIVDGRHVPPGTFYEDGTNGQAGKEEETFAPIEGLPPFIPEEKDVTVAVMKAQLEEWGIDYSDHTKDKPTLYAFFAEEVKKHGTGAAE